jgi:hypothetical protein
MRSLASFRAAAAAAFLLVPAFAQTVPCFDPSFGQNLALGDDAGASGLALGFSFPFGGQGYTTIAVCSNGYLWLGTPPLTTPWDYLPSEASLLAGQPRICPMWNDFNPSAAGSGQVYFNAVPAAGSNPGRAVITWDHVYEYGRTTPITMQCQLIDDGRIIFFYDPGIAAVLGGYNPGNQLVGMSPGGNSAANQVTWATLPLSMAGPTAHQLFASGQFNLIGRSLEFTPSGQGYLVVPRPQCVLGSFVKTGNGCPHDLTCYEAFGSGAVDLANTSIRFVPSAGGYLALPGPGIDAGYLTQVGVGDDVIVPTPLQFSFPFAGSSFNSMDVCSNGYVNLATGTAAQFVVQVTMFLGQNPRLCPLWVDLNPAAGGQVYIDSTPSQAMVTWVNVPEYGQAANTNTLQVKLLPNGEIVFSYGAVAISAHPSLAGITQGNGIADPGSMDLSASVPFQVGAPGSVPLTLDAAANSRPAIGTIFMLTAGNVPAGSSLAGLLLGFGTANQDLAPLGMPTCRGYLNPGTAVCLIGTVVGGSASFNVALPYNTGLVGTLVDSQAAAFRPGINPLGVVVSNGGRIHVAL